MVMGRNGHGPKWLWAEMKIRVSSDGARVSASALSLVHNAQTMVYLIYNIITNLRDHILEINGV